MIERGTLTVWRPYFGRILQPLSVPCFSGQPGIATSFTITNPLGSGNPLQMLSDPEGFRIIHAFVLSFGSVFFEQDNDTVAAVTT